MLTMRKDAGTGGRLQLYWNKRPVPATQYNEHWQLELDRVKAQLKALADEHEDYTNDSKVEISGLKYQQAHNEQMIKDLTKELDVTKASLIVSENSLKNARNRIMGIK